MRPAKHLRCVLEVLREEGLEVASIEEGSRHTLLRLTCGQTMAVGRGRGHPNPNVETFTRQQARRIMREFTATRNKV